MNNNKKQILMKIFEAVSCFLVVLYPILYMFFNNVGEAKFSDTFVIGFLYITMALIVFLIFLLIYRNISNAVLTSSIMLYFIIDYKKIEAFLQNLYSGIYYWHIVILMIFIIINIVLLLKQYNFKEVSNINKIVTVIFSILLIISFVQAVPQIIQYSKKNEIVQTSAQSVVIEDNKSKPNFYYFIFDEYGGYQNLKYFFNYEDELYNGLDKVNINIGYNSYNKDYFTARVLPDLMNLKFVTTESIKKQDVIDLLKNPKIYDVCRQFGYNINLIDGGQIFGTENVNSVVNANIKSDDTIFKWIISASLFFPLLTSNNEDSVRIKLDVLDYFANSYKNLEQSTCTIGYIGLPHPLFYFDENGNILNSALSTQLDNDIYLGQLKFTAKNIRKIINTIVKHDPNSVILIQSDHGSRLPYHRYAYQGGKQPTNEEYYQMKSILNLLYYKGETINIDNISGYDTLGLTIKKLFGYEAEYEN